MTERIGTKLGPIRTGGMGYSPEDDLPGDSLVVDPTPFVIDDFSDRTVAEPSRIAGTSLTIADAYIVEWNQAATSVEIPADPSTAYVAVSTSDRINSYIGSWYHPHTSLPAWTGCTGVTNAFTGWAYREPWKSIAIGAHPGSAAGLLLTIKATNKAFAGQGTGYGGAAAAAIDIAVMSSAPVDGFIKQGNVVATLPLDGANHEVFVPYANIPADGGTLYVGAYPNWTTNFGRAACGWTWPSGSSTGKYDMDGIDWLGRSGRADMTFVSAAWETWVVADDSLGSTNGSGSDEYEDRAWVDAGEVGSPTYGVDGNLYVKSTVASEKGFMLLGPEEDDDVDDGPWSDVEGVRMDLEFSISAVGEVGQSGTREIEMIVVGDETRASVKAHLGDAGTAAGVSADGSGVSTQFEAQTVAATIRHVLAMDNRSGKLRGKLWEPDGLVNEPAQWAVEVDMGETAETGDRFELWLRTGNIIGELQINVHKLTAYWTASDGDIIATELVGMASGDYSNFPTAHRFSAGTLQVFVNHGMSAPVSEDADEADFNTDGDPTSGSIIRVRYQKREEILTDEEEDDEAIVVID